jgi:hypothetical protein
MGIPVFLSFPTPHLKSQEEFIKEIQRYLETQGLDPATLGPSNYDMDAPLAGIRRLLVGCCGLLGVAFRRSLAPSLSVRSGADIPGVQSQVHSDTWLTSPYSQIEPAMAFQLGLPILLMKEKGVLAEGMFERGVTGLYLPEFSCDQPVSGQAEWTSVVRQWSGRVRQVYDRRGTPPALF